MVYTLYLIALFVLFSMLIITKNISSKSTWFMFSAILGWLVSLLGFVLYLGKDNFYYQIVTHFFNIPYSIWNKIGSLAISQIYIIRVLNFGIVLFIFSILSFSFAYTNAGLKNRKPYILFSIIPVFEFIIFDPSIYEKTYLYVFNGGKQLLSFNRFNTLINTIYIITKSLNIILLLFSIALLILYLFRNFYIPFIRNYTIFVLLGFTPIVLIFLLTFSWAPAFLLKVSAIWHNVSFVTIDLSNNTWLYFFYPYIVIIAFSVMIFSVWRFRSIEAFYKNSNIIISKSIEIANLGSRVLGHSIKNQLIAVTCEAAYLDEKLRNDPELHENISNIITISNNLIERLNGLYNKFDKIDLILRKANLMEPVENALAAIGSLPSNITLKKMITDKEIFSFIDTEHLSEALVVILNNAKEAIGNTSGTITIYVNSLDRWGIVSISDTGAGIKKEDLNKIFTPFFTTKPTKNNWGVGLSYAHMVIDSHNGRIFVSSEPGNDTTFKIFVPKIP